MMKMSEDVKMIRRILRRFYFGDVHPYVYYFSFFNYSRVSYGYDYGLEFSYDCDYDEGFYDDDD